MTGTRPLSCVVNVHGRVGDCKRQLFVMIVDKCRSFHYQVREMGRSPAAGPNAAAVGIEKGTGDTVAILAGIDEAGFGPLLGPLVVSCSVWAVPPELLEADLWQVFQRSLGKTRKHLAGRLLVADSKKAFHRAQGLGHLERTVLAALQAMRGKAADCGLRIADCGLAAGDAGAAPGGVGSRPVRADAPGPGGKVRQGPVLPTTVYGLLEALCPECLPRLGEYPWFQGLRERRLAAEPAGLKIAAQVLADDLQAHGAGLVALHSSCLDVAYYNRMVERVRNKAQVLFIAVTQLIQSILDQCHDDHVCILVDRQGGRARYRENLRRSFPGLDLRIVQEGDEVSTYEMRAGSRRVRLSFAVQADDLYLPVALASMVSKYVRELLMECMNDYFLALDANLKPTAGYWKDGTRFVAELRQRLPDLKIDRHRLIRCR
jgi:ribonuclease HII